MNFQKQHNYFGYIGKPLADAYCINNGFHDEMYTCGSKKRCFMNYLNKMDTFRTVNIADMISDNISLQEALAEYNASELRSMGLALPLNFSKQHINELNASYILNSSLCCVTTVTKKGTNSFFTTKNPNIFVAISNNIAETGSKKNLNNFRLQFTSSYSELSTGKFEILTLTNDAGGFKLGKAKVNCNSKDTILTTVYSLGNYVDSVFNYLCKNKVLILYTDGDKEKSLVTTLIPEIVQKWIYTKDKNEATRVIENAQNPYVFGELVLPNLYKRNDFVSLHVLSIKSIRNFQ